MTDDQKKKLETQLWNIADLLRGKMNADEFRDYWLPVFANELHLSVNAAFSCLLK